MKHFLESMRMLGNRGSLGSLVASAIMLGTLSLSAPASGRTGSASGLPLPHVDIDLENTNTNEDSFQTAYVVFDEVLQTYIVIDTADKLAASDKPADDDSTANDASVEDSSAENDDGTSPDDESVEFTGSSTPASRDLSVVEEKDLIFGGWN